ncbi:MAG: spore photoproduct lyase family protein [Patescibacteria group bacterium]
MAPKINIIQAKTILTKSGLPGATWVINPYQGCLFSCLYCYAAQIARWSHPDEEWGTYLDVKTNAPELLQKELDKLAKKSKSKNFGSIFFSSVTDPYVGLEAKYKLTRRCLEILADFSYAGEISILTKSPLVTRDLDILKKLINISVGFTVTSTDDKIARFLEVKAPPVSSRFDALRKLKEANISTYAFVGPLLPYFISNQTIGELLNQLQAAGVAEVWFEHINLKPRIKDRLYKFLAKENPELIPTFENANTEKYRNKLDKIIKQAMTGRNLKMGLNKVIYHNQTTKSK